jgi:uracil-DNA glycosylase
VNHPLDKHLVALGECRACPAMASTPVVSPPVHTKVIIVGQAPGVREPELQRPFAWTAGKTLFKWFESVSGADEETMRRAVYFAAVCRCFPGKGAKGGGDRVPDAGEIKNCSSWMRAEFEILQPDLVIPVGKLGISQFLDFKKLTEVIGGEYCQEVFGRKVDIIPLPHPSGVSTWFRTEPGKSLTTQALQKIGDHSAFDAAVTAAKV